MPATITIKGAASKEVIQDGIYRETGATALQVDGITDATADIVITDDIVLGTPGAYTVTYTLPEASTGEIAGDIVETRSVTVVAKVAPIDTTFDLGDENKKGGDTSGTKYDNLVDAAIAGTPPAEASSAYFSDTALDPYEVQHSK